MERKRETSHFNITEQAKLYGSMGMAAISGGLMSEEIMHHKYLSAFLFADIAIGAVKRMRDDVAAIAHRRQFDNAIEARIIEDWE